jgi:hypothetical protein
LRYIWLAASFAGLLAVLASDVRGAFGLALVWPVSALYLFKVRSSPTLPHARLKAGLKLTAALLLVAVLIPSPIVQNRWSACKSLGLNGRHRKYLPPWEPIIRWVRACTCGSAAWAPLQNHL